MYDQDIKDVTAAFAKANHELRDRVHFATSKSRTESSTRARTSIASMIYSRSTLLLGETCGGVIHASLVTPQLVILLLLAARLPVTMVFLQDKHNIKMLAV